MNRSMRILVCGGAAFVMALGMAITPAGAATANTVRVSFTSSGGQPDGLSYPRRTTMWHADGLSTARRPAGASDICGSDPGVLRGPAQAVRRSRLGQRCHGNFGGAPPRTDGALRGCCKSRA